MTDPLSTLIDDRDLQFGESAPAPCRTALWTFTPWISEGICGPL
jgi:hypothetical protein